MQEEWRPVVGFEGIYEVSSLGKVRSLDRYVTQVNRWGGYTKKFYKGKLLTLKPGPEGYVGITLGCQGSTVHTSLHRVVAAAFIPNPENLPQVNHKDENPSNNRADNLEWCTAEYNSNYGTRKEKLSSKLSGRKMPEDRKEKMRKERKGSGNPMYGRQQSAETREKIRASLVGQKRTPAQIEHIRQSRIGKTPWNKGLQTIPVLCLDEGIEFAGSRDAGEWLGVTSSAIEYACKHIACCKGHVFVYAKDAPEDTVEYVYTCYKHSGRYRELEAKWLDKFNSAHKDDRF